MHLSSTLLLFFSVISIWNTVDCGGGRRGAVGGEEDTVDESAERPIPAVDLQTVAELLDESGNDYYEYKTVVPDSVIVPIHFDASPPKRGGGRVFTDVIEKKGGARRFPEKRGGARTFPAEEREGDTLFKR